MNEALGNAVRSAVSATPAGQSARITAELGAITRLVLSAPRLGKALAAPDASDESKASLLNDLTKNAFSPTAIDLVVAVGRQRFTGSRFAAALVDISAEYAFASATDSTVETQLYDFADVIKANDELRDALANPGVTDAAKDKLVRELLNGKADPSTIDLVRSAVAAQHGRDVEEQVRRLSLRSAELRNLVVAEVQTAIELDGEHRRKLADALSQQVGKQVEPRFSVDPTILGSVIVRIGDEVLDGSVRHRLNQARQALLG